MNQLTTDAGQFAAYLVEEDNVNCTQTAYSSRSEDKPFLAGFIGQWHVLEYTKKLFVDYERKNNA
ncbi:hypothetical protein [Planctobacterium marinum]|uniref:hypothetical protein n=1 Tax=Planctobacterium marinum TaxID=1631968 RepID=UPI001E291B3E|nr:hypothetical protein [Planctobacterium marinum]MCC2606777.1 hypothetical protein [Planctobacterium marinum]